MGFVPARVLVTGAGGFVGRHLLAALREALPKAELVGTSQDGSTIAGADRVQRLELTDPAGIAAVVAAVRPEACIHLAALTAVGSSFAEPEAVWQANVDGTRALATALNRHVPDAWLLHVSSVEVYGLAFRSGEALTEQTAMQPANPYAAAKAAVDLCLGEMALRGLRVVRLRPANHIGPGQTERFVVAAFARQIARIEAGLQEPVVATGALDRCRDFLDVRDVCRAYVAALERADTLPSGVALNVASGRSRNVREVLDDLLRLAAVEARVDEHAAERRPLDLVTARCDVTAARQALDWTPTIPWERTLADVLAYWRAVVRDRPPPPTG